MSNEFPYMILLLTGSAAVALSIGNILEKIGLSSTRTTVPLRSPVRFLAAIIRNWHWWLGMVLSGYGTVAYMTAMSNYNLSLVQSLMCLNPVLTAIMGRWLLGEYLDRNTLKGIIWNTVGLLLVSTQVQEAPGVVQPHALWPFVAGLVMALGLVFALKKGHFEYKDAMLTGAGFGLSAVFWKFLSSRLQWDALGEWQGSAWSDALVQPALWGYVLFYLVGFAFSQIALARGRALFIIPFSTALGTFIPILGGWIVFAEPMGIIKSIAFVCIGIGSLLFIKSAGSQA
jgi:drug/metabolite transporter (DMT)-like permease